MYKITLRRNNDKKEYTLHNPKTNDLLLINPKLTLELNKTGTLTFEVPITHPYYNKISKMQCEITVYQDNKILYVGRPLNSEDDFYRTSSVICEGVLAYLLDSIQRPYEYKGNIYGFFKGVILNHNNYMGSNDYKKFEVGICDVADSNNYINRSSSEYTNTLNVINEKLINTHGGYLSVRFENNTRYIDYKVQAGKQNKQPIRFAENLLDLTQFIKSDNLVTAIIPLGAETEEIGINGTNKRVTIESVNSGLDYIVDETAVNNFGLIYGTIEFDDVALPSNLKTKAQKYLEQNKNLSLTIELSAVDLSLLNSDIENFNLGDYIRVISKPHNIDSYFLLSKYEINIADVSKNTITLGKTLTKLSSTVTKNQNNATTSLIKKTNALNSVIENAVENATNLITGCNGGYLYFKQNDDGQPEELYILDTPSIDEAQNVIRLNRNGLGFSRTGYNGTFANAWTIDGSLVADFITSGTLNADIIKTGKITSLNNPKVYFDLTNGELSGSKLIDTASNSSLKAEFGSTSIDNALYKGFVIYDKNNSFDTELSDVGGIIRYKDDVKSTNIGVYSKGNLILSAFGTQAKGSSMCLSRDSIYINRKFGEDENYTTDTTTVFSSTAEELFLQHYKTSSEYSYLKMEKDTMALYKKFPPTTGIGTDNSCGICLERGQVGINVDDNVIFSVTSSGATVKGITVTSDRKKKRDICKNDNSVIDKVMGLSFYNYKLLDDDIERYGFMADEVPNEMLGSNGKSVDIYGGLAIALRCVQELSNEIAELKQQIKELKANG